MITAEFCLLCSWSFLLIAGLHEQPDDSQKLCDWSPWSAWGSCDQPYKFRERDCPENCYCEGKKYNFEICDFGDLDAPMNASLATSHTSSLTVATTASSQTSTTTAATTKSNVTVLDLITHKPLIETPDTALSTISTYSSKATAESKTTNIHTAKSLKLNQNEADDSLATVLKLYKEELERLKQSQQNPTPFLPVSNAYQYGTRQHTTAKRSTLAQRKGPETTIGSDLTEDSTLRQSTTSARSRVTIPWYSVASASPPTTSVALPLVPLASVPHRSPVEQQPALSQVSIATPSPILLPVEPSSQDSTMALKRTHPVSQAPTAAQFELSTAAWSECLPSCGPGMKFRENICGAQGQKCKEWAACNSLPCTTTQSNGYWSNPIPPVDSSVSHIWSVWSDWSSCTCKRYRSRTCLDPTGPNCVGVSSDYTDCSNVVSSSVSTVVPFPIRPPSFTPPSVQHVPLRPGDYVIGPGSLPNVGCSSASGCNDVIDGQQQQYGYAAVGQQEQRQSINPDLALNAISRKFRRPLASAPTDKSKLKQS